MTTEQLNEFYILSTTLSYSEAAEKLFISQSVLSRHIKNLEEELNVALFVRTTRKVALTNEGKIFQSQVPRLLKRATDIESLVNLKMVNTSGNIRILFAPQTLNSRILQFLRDFQEQYKNIHLDFMQLIAHTDFELIYKTDIMISPCDFTKTKPADIEAVLAAKQSALLAVPPYHHFSEEPSVSLFDLRNETLIVPYVDELEGPYARLAFIANRKCYGHLAKISASTEEQALLQVELGYGVMLLPHHLKHHVHVHTSTVPISDAECFFPIYVYHNLNHENGAAVLFFNNMREHFQKKE